jgi:hypothetical protein
MTADGVDRREIGEALGRSVHACASRGVLLGIRKDRSAVLANRKRGRDAFWDNEDRVARWRKNVARQFTPLDRMIRAEELRQRNRAGITGIKGRGHSADAKERIRKALKGRTYTAQHRAKIARARKRYWIRWRAANGKPPKHQPIQMSRTAKVLPDHYGLPVSMTFPQSMRNQCRVGENVVQLTPAEARVFELLLLRGIGRHTAYSDLVELMWPDPNDEPEDATGYLKVYVCKLRGRGIAISTLHGRGVGISDC